MLLVAALFLSASPTDQPREMEVAEQPGGGCSVRVEGHWFDLRHEADQFGAFIENLPDKQRRVTIAGETPVSYRCIGGIIYQMQRSGFTRISAISEPPEPDDR